MSGSSAELAGVARQARLLHEGLGLAPGAHAALLIGNRVEAVVAVLGALHAGVWMTPINWHLTGSEIAYVLRDSGARVLFTDPEHEDIARRAASEAGTVFRCSAHSDSPRGADLNIRNI